MQTKILFPTTIGVEIVDKKLCEITTKQIKKIILNKDTLPDNGLCITTSDNLDQKEEFKDLYNLISLKINDYATNILGIKENSLKCNGMWANVHKKFSKHHYHQHPNSYISGVLFLDIPICNSPGDFVFVDPRISKTMAYADFKDGFEYANNFYNILPQTGLLLLFPSWLIHGTNVFIPVKNEKRYSLSFNYSLTKCSEPTAKIR